MHRAVLIPDRVVKSVSHQVSDITENLRRLKPATASRVNQIHSRIDIGSLLFRWKHADKFIGCRTVWQSNSPGHEPTRCDVDPTSGPKRQMPRQLVCPRQSLISCLINKRRGSLHAIDRVIWQHMPAHRDRIQPTARVRPLAAV